MPGVRSGLSVLLALATGAAPALGQAAAERAAAPRPRAVVLVTIDTLRGDFVSFNGHERETTPHLEALAMGGATFTRAYSTSSWTPPAMASLFTGVHPTSHGVLSGDFKKLEGTNQRLLSQPTLAESFVTLAERFKEAGYLTIGVNSNLHLQARLGFGQGFDYYPEAQDFLTANLVNHRLSDLLRSAFGPAWRTSWDDQPVFLWLHYFDPHDPYSAQQPWISRFAPERQGNLGSLPHHLTMPQLWRRYPRPGARARADLQPLYESEIAFADEHVRWLTRQMALDGGDVLLVVTSDHGEELGDHGGLGHGNTLFDEVVRVPLLFRWPARIPPGGRFDGPVSLVDVYPTLLDLAGLTVPGEGLQGRSLMPALLGAGEGAAGGDRLLFLEVDQPEPVRQVQGALVPLVGVTDGRYKLVRPRRPGAVASLYDLVSDPGEMHDVASTNEAETARLDRALTDWLKSLPPPPPDRLEAILEDEALRERLKALGYLD